MLEKVGGPGAVRVCFGGGIYVAGRRASLAVDPSGGVSRRVDFALVTHAHSDHVARGALGLPIVATRETAAAISVRFGRAPARAITVRVGDVIEIEGVHVAVLEAGHIPGSSMYLVEIDGVQLLFTGDFNTAGSILADAAEPVERPDALIMEATYGDPAYIFPNRAEVYSELVGLVENRARDGGVAVIAYPLGKAQEVFRLLGPNVMTHSTISRYNRALGFHAGRRSNVVIVPGARHAPSGYFRVAVSGWYASEAVRREAARRGIHGIPLSDHSDFSGLVEFALRASPKRAYVAYGLKERFARYLRRLGLDAGAAAGGTCVRLRG
jgi:putative mRNA 3-end processing factor